MTTEDVRFVALTRYRAAVAAARATEQAVYRPAEDAYLVIERAAAAERDTAILSAHQKMRYAAAQRDVAQRPAGQAFSRAVEAAAAEYRRVTGDNPPQD